MKVYINNQAYFENVSSILIQKYDQEELFEILPGHADAIFQGRIKRINQESKDINCILSVLNNEINIYNI